jgi:signal transduction histidine kinase
VDGGVLLSVDDPGIGLPPGASTTIFEPFGRARNAETSSIPGLGLGLHISRGIVERHGGRIWAESKGEGRGTTVHVWLPSRPPEEAPVLD